jgi:hypothetical protein
MTHTVFLGHRRIASGSLADAARAVLAAGPDAMPLVFDDATGAVVDIDTRGSEADVIARLAPPPRGRGRPILGVTAREVTLLPRHWDWLATQPGGASVTLRRLVDAARKDGADEARAARDAAYRFMMAIGGDLPGFEDASRALFAGDRAALSLRMATWPADVRDHVLRMLGA